jgi:hypothetical protein
MFQQLSMWIDYQKSTNFTIIQACVVFIFTKEWVSKYAYETLQNSPFSI